MNRSNAAELLELADREPNRLHRHLLVAAALDAAFSRRAIVVGGTAEEYWTRDEYHPTDLDICMPVTPTGKRVLAGFGFEREGRHWIRGGDHPVAVEFPDDSIEGDEGRVVDVSVGTGTARMIGIEDLYLDRIRQATATPDVESIALTGAAAIVAARYEETDWGYVQSVIRRAQLTDPSVGALMKALSRRVRTRVRRALTRPD